MQYYEFIAGRGDTGAALPYAKIYVYLTGTATLASIYDIAGAGLSNPVTATMTGEVGFAAANGAYDIQIGSADGTYLAPKVHGVQFYDLAGLDAQVAAAASSVATCTAQAAIATSQATVASNAATVAVNALAATAITATYGTYALANAALGSIAANAFIQVLADENHNGVRTIYQKVSGSLVYNGEASGGPSTKYQIATIAPPTIDTGTSQNFLSFTAPDRTDADGTHSNNLISLGYAFSPVAAGGVGSGSPKFTDIVLSIGQNATTSFTPLVAGRPAFTDRWESKWCITSASPGNPYIFQGERHVGAFWTASANLNGTGAGEEIRPITIGIPWTTDMMKYDLSVTQRAAIYTWYAGNGTEVAMSLGAAGAAPSAPIMSLHPKFAFTHLGNNYPLLRQYNQANTAMINLPFLNANDQLQEDMPSDGTLTTWRTNSLSIYSAWARNCGSVPNGARLMYLGAAGASLATCNAYEAAITASTVVNNVLNNQHATGAACQQIQAVAGNVSVQFTTNGVTANLLFNGVRLSSDKPVKLPTLTVATLPSASSAGAGAKAFVSDALAPTFMATVAAGGSVFAPVYSDGTNWKVG